MDYRLTLHCLGFLPVNNRKELEFNQNKRSKDKPALRTAFCTKQITADPSITSQGVRLGNFCTEK